jgi:hypothetical protein
MMGWYDDGKRRIKHTHTPDDWDALKPQLEALGGAGTVFAYGTGNRLGNDRGQLTLDADRRPQTVDQFVWIMVAESEVSRMTTELANLLG